MFGVKQALIAGLSASAVAGGGYGTYYLLKDKTIEDRLNREEFNLIKVSEVYQVAFKELKGEVTFIEDIKSYDTDITAKSEFNKGGEALSKWCNEKIKESLSVENVDELINKVKEYCKNRPLTIVGKLSGKLLTTGWTQKLGTLKISEKTKDTKLLDDLKTIDGKLGALEPSKDNNVEKALEGWCKDKEKTKLVDDKDDAILTKVKNRCTNN